MRHQNPQSLSTDAVLARIGAQKWPVVRVERLFELGLSRYDVRHRIARGQLHRQFVNVYSVGRRDLPRRGQLYAALLAAGEGAFLSHQTAAADRGLRKSQPREIHVTVPHTWTPPRQPGLVVHRTTLLLPSDVTTSYGLRVASVPRILVDLAPRTAARDLSALITAAVRRQSFRPVDVAAAIALRAGHPGMLKLAAAMARYDPNATDRSSEFERSFERHERTDSRLPTPVYNMRLDGWELDVAFVAQKVALELDGRPYHVAVQDFDKDHRKDRKLTILGWTPVRITEFEWEYGQKEVLEDLYTILGV
jgi:very-short-patch-repair endonuclease